MELTNKIKILSGFKGKVTKTTPSLWFNIQPDDILTISFKVGKESSYRKPATRLTIECNNQEYCETMNGFLNLLSKVDWELE